MDLIPAIDLRLGRAVRLRQGDDARRSVVADDPAALVAAFGAAQVARVHVVDLDAALGEPAQGAAIAALIARGAEKGVEIQLGGGLRDEESIAAALDLGAARAVVGSLVARDPERFAALARSFPGRLVPALDVRDGEVRVAGWREGSARPLDDLASALAGLPCPAVLVTDVLRDGMMGGPNLALARRVARWSGLPALVSGGVASLDDLAAARVVPEIGGAIVGQALYTGAFTVEQALAVAAGEAVA